MSTISTLIAQARAFVITLRSSIWAIDVRDGIGDSIQKLSEAIEQCYSDVSNPTLQTEALEAALQNKIDEGEMAALTIGDHTITAEKLAQGVIDNTLATSGAAADAKKTGDEITALKADLDAVENNVFSVDAKYALAKLLKNVVSADENANQLYENLINAMGVDMLKENIFIYLPNQFGDLSLVQGSAVIGNVGVVTKGLGINHNADMSSKYRVFGVSNGKSESQKYMGLQSGTYFDLYPIPVPADATSAWIGVFPSSQYISSRLIQWDETSGAYVAVENANQKTQGSHIKTFSSGNNMFLMVMSAYDAQGSVYANDPEAVVVVFKE